MWTSSPDEVDGYRIYKGDANNRVFVEATTETRAAVDMLDGESLFLTAFRGVLESEPTHVLTFALQASSDLTDWQRVAQAAPTGPQYFTRFKIEEEAQPAPLVANNSTSLPAAPSFLRWNPVPSTEPMIAHYSWLQEMLAGPPLLRSAAEGAPVNPGIGGTEITSVGQRCRVGDAEPYEWYWAPSLTHWEKEGRALGIHELPTPWIIAHRGGWNVAPEHTLEAYRMCVASGVQFIEPDVQVLSDGTVVVMHDPTLTRTTTSSGPVSDQTGFTWGSLVNDDGARLKGWATRLGCPTFDEVLREFGNRVVIVPEAKNAGAGAAIVRKLQEFNIRKDMVIIQGSITELAAGVAAGYPCMRMSSTAYAETIAAGIGFTGFGWNETAKIEAATTAGLKVIVWTTQRNVEMESAVAAGAIAVFSDDPVYQLNLHRRQQDPYDSKAIYHGHLRGTSTAGSLDIVESAIVIPTQSSGRQDTVLLGWASPVNDAEHYILEFSMKFTGVAMDSSYGMIAMQTTDRVILNDTPEADKVSMNLIMRRDGRMEIGVSDGLAGGPHAVSSEAAIPADLIALDSWTPYRLTVSPTRITLERLDSVISVGIDNNQIRGASLFAGSKGADVKFKSLTLID
jgi:glycerophosphoryl diester phosphodiesterase